MINIQILPAYRPSINKKLINNTVNTALVSCEIVANTDLSVVIVGENGMQQLNKQYSDKDAPTDVLSFPSNTIDPETSSKYIGDIIICYPIAIQNAEKANHSVDDEVQLLIVHGILHLLGFDHYDEDSKAEMWSKQQIILNKLGCNIHP
jgi:probable rRNA maturation factor